MIQIELQNGTLTHNTANLLDKAVEHSLPNIGVRTVRMNWNVQRHNGRYRVCGNSKTPDMHARVEMEPLPDGPQDSYRLTGIKYRWSDEHNMQHGEHWTLNPLTELYINCKLEKNEPKYPEEIWEFKNRLLQFAQEMNIKTDDGPDPTDIAIDDDIFDPNLQESHDISDFGEADSALKSATFEELNAVSSDPLDRKKFTEVMGILYPMMKNTLIQCFRDQHVTEMDGHGDPLFDKVMILDRGPETVVMAKRKNGRLVDFEDLSFGQIAYLVDEIL